MQVLIKNKSRRSKKILNRAIQEAQIYLRYSTDPANDYGHGQRTAENARVIGKMMGFTDVKMLETCGWWHDVGRLIDPPNHERVSAQMLRVCLRRLGASSELSDKAYSAIVSHGKYMQPETIEGNIVRDADKLEYISIERWEACLRHQHENRLVAYISLLAEFPDFLALEPSRELFDQRMQTFHTYLSFLRIGDMKLSRAVADFLAR